MPERIHWSTVYVQAVCAIHSPGCDYHERIEDPTPDQQKRLIRRAREHARRAGHHQVSIERGQCAGVEP